MISYNLQKASIEKVLFLFLIILGVFYRLYNSNFEDYWLDELFGFWLSDPKLSFNETYERSLGPGWGQNMLFDFVLKYFYKIFSYFPENGRIFTATISSLTIPLVAFLSYQIDKSKSYLLTTFIISHCWYLISYAQEVRSYSFGYLLSVLSLIIFISIIQIDQRKLKKLYILIFLLLAINLLGLINHIFFGIIIFSQFLFFLNFTKDKLKFKYITYSFLTLGLIYLILMFPFLLKNLTSDDFWVSNINLKFFTDLIFFPRFFGSKIMGFIYLSSLIFLTFKCRKFILNKKSNYQFLFILLISSYFLPIIYGFVKTPILIDRYIIFVVTPIILLISHFIFKQKKNVKWILIFIICLSTFGNNYLEIFMRKNSKPEFNKSLEYISKSKNKNIVLISSNKDSDEWMINYLKKISYSKYKNLIFLENNQFNDVQKVWAVCYLPLSYFKCNTGNEFENFKLVNIKKFHLVNIILYKKI